MEFEHPVNIWLQGDPEVIRDYLDLNIYGIVTNTIILDDMVDKYGPMVPLIERYLTVMEHDEPLVVEIDGETVEDMLAASAVFTEMSPRVVMKIPMSMKGLHVIAALKARGRRTVATTTFSVSQAVAAAQAGAAFVAPFVGPTVHAGYDTRRVLEDIVRVFRQRKNMPYIAAGIVRDVVTADIALRAGCDGVIVFPHTFEEMMLHPGTEQWNRWFREKWDNMRAKGALEGVPE